MIALALPALLALVLRPPPHDGPTHRPSTLLPLGVLSTVPVAIGSFNTAVQLVGELNNRQAVLMQCGSYAVACCSLCVLRLAKHGSVRVDRQTMRAGLELGLWIGVGGTLQSLGLQATTADRAGYLVQLSAVLVPLAECLLNRARLSLATFAAMACSLLGVALLVLTPGEAAAAAGKAALWRGDALVAASSLFYSAHILRLGALAKRHADPLQLASAKAFASLCVSVAMLAGLTLGAAPTGARLSLSLRRSALPTMLFTGTVTCAYPMWAQAYGQRAVRPSHAALIYSTAPLWNGLFAVLLLGQRLRPRAVAGAALMTAGFVLMTRAEVATPLNHD